MRVALALALTAAAGFGLTQVGNGPDLRAVDAPAAAIEKPDGALLAALEFDGPARLLWVRPGSLRPVTRPIELRENFVADSAVSPDGSRLAVASEMRGRIDVVDLRRWRSLGPILLSPGGARSDGASGLVWAGPRRLLALSGLAFGAPASPVVIDPVSRRVVHAPDWRGRPLQPQAAGDRMVFLDLSQGGSKPHHARLVSFDAGGRVRELELDAIEAGTWDTRPRRWRRVEPALAVTPDGRRAYVVAAHGRLVAEVDLRRWRLTYHEVTEPVSAWRRLMDLVEAPAYAKVPGDMSVRYAEVLPGGAIAVTGEDTPATDPPHGAQQIPWGVRLIDPATWTVRTVDADAQWFTTAGGLLLARRWSMPGGQRPIGLRAYDTAGELRWERFKGADTIVRGAAGRRAYVEVKRDGRRRIHVLDIDTGRTERTLPWSEIRVLDR